MKKGLMFFLIGILIFPSCHRATAAPTALSGALKRIEAAIDTGEGFVTADADFIADHFGNEDFITESAVCFGNGETVQEFGIFRLADRKKAALVKENIRKYLNDEESSLNALASLYPAEELEARLHLYKKATVGSEGMLVYYFILNEQETRLALEALTGR